MLVAIEKRLGGAPREHQRKLPPQVRRVLQPGALPLAPRRTMRLRCIAGEENAPSSVALGYLMVQAKALEPPHVGHLARERREFVEELLQLTKGEVPLSPPQETSWGRTR